MCLYYDAVADSSRHNPRDGTLPSSPNLRTPPSFQAARFPFYLGADIQTVKIEMLSEFAQAHAKKQRIRQLIFASTTEQELEEIQWNAHE